MAITIDWATKVISVPKADMTLVQSNPIEIRELNLNDFRLTLKSLEDDEDGIAYIQTHIHNTEVLLGGIVYARVIEIINGYTVTFENGSYAVNLVGANSNIGDVVNLNSVSVRSTNAAGLISNQAIEFSSFNGGVTVDNINGTNGTVFPRGTPQLPVNNIPDAIIIAQLRGFNTIYIKNDFTFDSGDNLEGFSIIGASEERSFLTFNPNAVVPEINVFNATVTGVFDTTANFNTCRLINTQFVKGIIKNCILEGTVTLAGSGATSMIDCSDGLVSDNDQPAIDFGGNGNSLAIRNYHGDLHLKNKSGVENVEINVTTGGHITLESSISNGIIRITGIAKVTDNTTGSTIVDVSQVIFPDQLQLSSFRGFVHLNTTVGISGTKFPIGTDQTPSNNIIDSLQILSDRGLESILLSGPLYLTDVDLSDKLIVGENNLDAVVILISGNTTNRTTFKNLIVVGELNGHVFVENCGLQTLRNVGSDAFPSIFRNCIIRADSGGQPAIKMSNSTSGQTIHFVECVSAVPGDDAPTLDFNNSNMPISIRKFGGGIKLKNITENQDSSVEIDQGQVILDSSCTNGVIRLGGIYKLTDNSTLTIEERNQSITDGINFNNATFSADTEAISAAVWDKLTADHETANTFGKMLNDILVATGQAQHSLNVNTELLQNKPNNP